jgi:hypothetical protein
MDRTCVDTIDTYIVLTTEKAGNFQSFAERKGLGATNFIHNMLSAHDMELQQQPAGVLVSQKRSRNLSEMLTQLVIAIIARCVLSKDRDFI